MMFAMRNLELYLCSRGFWERRCSAGANFLPNLNKAIQVNILVAFATFKMAPAMLSAVVGGHGDKQRQEEDSEGHAQMLLRKRVTSQFKGVRGGGMRNQSGSDVQWRNKEIVFEISMT